MEQFTCDYCDIPLNGVALELVNDEGETIYFCCFQCKGLYQLATRRASP